MDELVKLQDELDALASKQSNLEAEMQHDMMKQQAVRLYEKLNDLKQKQNQLEEEDQSNLSPEQEQQQLLATVKSLNQEISSMDRQSKELDDKVRAMQEELQQVEDELEDQEVNAVELVDLCVSYRTKPVYNSSASDYCFWFLKVLLYVALLSDSKTKKNTTLMGITRISAESPGASLRC